MALQAPSLTRTQGDAEDPLSFEVLTRTGLSTTQPEDLSGATVFLTIREENNTTPLTEFNDFQIPAPDITDPLLGQGDLVMSGLQIAQLLSASATESQRYTMKIRVEFPSTKQRSYPNDLTPDGSTSIIFLILLINPA